MSYIVFNAKRLPGGSYGNWQYDTISIMSNRRDNRTNANLKPNRNPIPSYLVEEHQFETTLQIVSVKGGKFLLQDLYPDPGVHLGMTPMYEATAAYMVKMLQAYDVVDGQMTGAFEFRGRGGAVSLALAK